MCVPPPSPPGLLIFLFFSDISPPFLYDSSSLIRFFSFFPPFFIYLVSPLCVPSSLPPSRSAAACHAVGPTDVRRSRVGLDRSLDQSDRPPWPNSRSHIREILCTTFLPRFAREIPFASYFCFPFFSLGFCRPLLSSLLRPLRRLFFVIPNYCKLAHV